MFLQLYPLMISPRIGIEKHDDVSIHETTSYITIFSRSCISLYHSNRNYLVNLCRVFTSDMKSHIRHVFVYYRNPNKMFYKMAVSMQGTSTDNRQKLHKGLEMLDLTLSKSKCCNLSNASSAG